MHYIGLGKRPAVAERLAWRPGYDDELVKRKSPLNYIGLGKKSAGDAPERRRYGDARRRRRLAKRAGRRRVRQPARHHWSSSTVDPALLVMGIGRK